MCRRTSLKLLLAWATLSGLCCAMAEARLDDRTLTITENERLVRQQQFPEIAGNLTEPITFQGNIYLGVGPAVFAFAGNGQLLGRADLPGQTTALDTASGAVRVSTQGNGYTELFTLGEPERNLHIPVQERVVMPLERQITGWLARAADQVPSEQIREQIKQDPANPFLALRLAQLLRAEGDDYGALSAVRQALGVQMPFPAWTQLAVRLDTIGYPAAADLALNRAKRDAAMRGIDPDIPVGTEAMRVYGDPVVYASALVAQGRLERAAEWMSFLRELYPLFEGHEALYERYAFLLESQGRPGEAAEWRQFSRQLRAGSLYNLGTEDTRILRDAARLSTLTLVLALLTSLLTLQARAWRAQGQDTRTLGGRLAGWRRPLIRSRLTLISYASLSERFMLFLLSVGLLLSLVGWQWANQTRQGLRSPALNMGTYGGGWYASHIDDLNLRFTPDTAILAGLAAQLDGDSTTARDFYLQAGQDACALNNLGVIAHEREDNVQALEEYRAALALRPDLNAAQYNVGLNNLSPGASFQRTYRRDQPRLCYPDRRSTARMVSGDLSVALRRNLLNPLGFVQQQGPAQRLGAVIALVMLGLSGLALLLLVPRAASETRLGRPALYRALAFLFPGTALLSNPWGGVLLLTWAALVIALLPLTGLVRYPVLLPLNALAWRSALLLTLVGTYVLNTVALIAVETRFVRQRRLERLEES